MKLIDSHCHLNLPEFAEDYAEIFARCQEREIGVMNVGCDYASSERAVAVAQELGEGAWAAIGQHPTDSGEEFDYDAFLALAKSSPKVKAIGETGLDYYRLPKPEENEEAREEQISRQKHVFLEHLELAHETDLPLIIHCRDAHDDMIEILGHSLTTPSAHGQHEKKEFGVMHCFTGTKLEAESYLDLGFLISFTGIITFADQYDEVVRAVPLEKILIETDSPYLAPVPYRGKRNQPVYVEEVAKRIAELKGLSYDEVARQTTENAKRLFKLM